MDKKTLMEMSTECLQYANELAKDSGVPEIGLVGYFSQLFFDLYLRTGMAENMPIQGMILNHTKEYYRYCKDAIAFLSSC